mgnify:CR=1 FL=1
MVDIDLGEMFLNFPLHKILQKFPGVNFSHYAADLNAECANNKQRVWNSLLGSMDEMLDGPEAEPVYGSLTLLFG